MVSWIVFAAATLLLLFVSRRSLAVVGSHGFYRFFACETILAVLVLNAPVWFRAPLSWHQIISWILLITSVPIAVAGVYELRSVGKPHARRDDASLIAFERTTTLVTTGIYSHIRHPMYSSLLLLVWGGVFKDPQWTVTLLGITASFFLMKTARADEAECVRYFGSQYQTYMEETKMFIPYFV